MAMRYSRFQAQPARSINAASAALTAIWLAALAGTTACAQDRTPRYRPEGGDFVIGNGKSFFNRPLYGGNTGFRIETGDRPEFAFHFPGRAGNLRIGLLGASDKAIWCFDAKSVVARYRPGSMIHEIRDPLLGNGALTLTGIPAATGEGFALRAELAPGSAAVRLIWAFGGSDGNKGRRNGDLNAENEPLDRFFRFTPERAKGGRFELQPSGFTHTGKPGKLHALLPPGAAARLADSAKWPDPAALVASPASAIPVATGTFDLTPAKPFHLALLREVTAKGDAARIFTDAETKRRSIAERVVIRTPDPHLNAASAALNVAADAIWDGRSGSYMHGAIGWRVPLLGWRGPYAGDALGDHGRTRSHIESYGKKQITTPPPAAMPPADAKFNLARSLTALNTNGIFSGSFISFYDMNTVAVDAMFRHLRWTGDRAAAERFQPVLDRHLDWQKRLFRRPFPDENSPLYEAYACIWASDELIYSGGGATHSTAYQLHHRRMAARVARLLGRDPAPHEREAAAIARTLRGQLWMPESGTFAEFRDLLGNRLLHPSPALWTFYHTVDSEAATPLEAWQMARFVETGLPRIPMKIRGDAGAAFQLPTTNWHPYHWSTNNVALAESSHTALALWQTGRRDLALPLLKGALLESMFLGPCPGNVGMTTPSDVFSGERYRDFADGAGILARTFVEGLFGIRPDLLDGKLLLEPGFPGAWNEASIRHPRIDYAFRREGHTETHQLACRFARQVETRLRIPARTERIDAVTIDGRPAKWRIDPEALGEPMLEIIVPPAATSEIRIVRAGVPAAEASTPPVAALGEPIRIDVAPAAVTEIIDPQRCLENASINGSVVTGKVIGSTGHRTVFLRVQQGSLHWIEPAHFEIRPPVEILQPERTDPGALAVRVRNNLAGPLDGTLALEHGGTPVPLALPAGSTSEEIRIPSGGLTPGTHRVSFHAGNRVARGTATNWRLDPAKSEARWETVDLTGSFNELITRIFQQEYLSPRSPYCSLALPKSGIGGWCHFDVKVDIDDAGLRSAAGNGGIYQSPVGVPFRTPGPGGDRNVLFVSRWDNFPKEADVPLSGTASRLCLLMAGSTNPMQSRLDNGEVVVTYADGGTERLALHNPTTWWPIDRDYHINRLAFAVPAPAPPRLDLKSGKLRIMDPHEFTSRAQNLPGGAATVLDLPLDPKRELRTLTVRALANDVVIGLMAASLERR